MFTAEPPASRLVVSPRTFWNDGNISCCTAYIYGGHQPATCGLWMLEMWVGRLRNWILWFSFTWCKFKESHVAHGYCIAKCTLGACLVYSWCSMNVQGKNEWTVTHHKFWLSKVLVFIEHSLSTNPCVSQPPPELGTFLIYVSQMKKLRFRRVMWGPYSHAECGKARAQPQTAWWGSFLKLVNVSTDEKAFGCLTLLSTGWHQVQQALFLLKQSNGDMRRVTFG